MSDVTIPEDIRNTANSIAWDLPSRVMRANREFASNVIARAIVAEREREPDLIAALTAFDKAVNAEGFSHRFEQAPNGDWLFDCMETINLTETLRKCLAAAIRSSHE